MDYKLTLTKTERGKSIKIGELTLKSDPSQDKDLLFVDYFYQLFILNKYNDWVSRSSGIHLLPNLELNNERGFDRINSLLNYIYSDHI